jgi:hypothetical protein
MDFKAGCESFNWLRIGPSGGHLWTRQRTFEFHRRPKCLSQMRLFASVWQRKLSQIIMFHISVRDMNGSDFCWDTDHPDWDFSWFTSVPPRKHCDKVLKWPRLPPSISFLVHSLLPSKYPTLHSLSHWQHVAYVGFGSACHPLSRWFIAWLILRPWRWKRNVSLKRRLNFNGLHGVIAQKIELFSMLHKLQIKIQKHRLQFK